MNTIVFCIMVTLSFILEDVEPRMPLDNIIIVSGTKEKYHYNHIPTSSWDPDIRGTNKGNSTYKKISIHKDDPIFGFNMEMYCPRDYPVMCMLYDKMGNAAGMQVGFTEKDIVERFNKEVHSPPNSNFMRIIIFNIPVYVIRIFFTNPETLTPYGRNDTSEIIEGGLWVHLDGELMKISRCQPNGPVTGVFYMQGCYSESGVFFEYKSHYWSTCRRALLLFFMYHEMSLIGFGIGGIGKASPGPDRDLYFYPTLEAMEIIKPNSPPCLVAISRASNQSFTSLRVLLVSEPWTIRCPNCLH